MDFNLTEIKESKDEILEAMVRDDAINADISCLMDCYVDVELKYWKDKGFTAKELVDMIIKRGAKVTSELLSDFKLDHEVLTLPDNWNGGKREETNDG